MVPQQVRNTTFFLPFVSGKLLKPVHILFNLLFYLCLGPSIHGLVTDIQVNVCIGPSINGLVTDAVTYIRLTRNSNTIPILNSNNTVVYLTQVNEGNSISFIYTVGFYRCFGIYSVISLCLPKLLTPLYTPKLYNNDNYESLDIFSGGSRTTNAGGA